MLYGTGTSNPGGFPHEGAGSSAPNRMALMPGRRWGLNQKPHDPNIRPGSVLGGQAKLKAARANKGVYGYGKVG